MSTRRRDRMSKKEPAQSDGERTGADPEEMNQPTPPGGSLQYFKRLTVFQMKIWGDQWHCSHFSNFPIRWRADSIESDTPIAVWAITEQPMRKMRSNCSGQSPSKPSETGYTTAGCVRDYGLQISAALVSVFISKSQAYNNKLTTLKERPASRK
ncbi:hypothetical protein T10_1065 [Trichinella papuae]|uniref:Uncharacterized protein n=1 Tax=Trichinella papuae TaxID=268474 RepID=A0A0V1MBY4_9BILA|nr:hypothetical protein T10_1065 [Trichinella papuae]